jgi:hypothetical protein
MYSPDGRWWWNGAAWIPTPQWRTRYEHTPWTRKLQIAVLGLQALGLLFAAATFPFIYSSMLDTNALFASNPTLANDPQTADFFRQIFLVCVVGSVVISLVVLAVIVIGVLKLWRWLYWYLMITYGIALLSIPVNLSYALGNGPIHYPSWYFFLSIPIVLAEGALSVWMIVGYRRYGNWARRKIVEPA